MTADSLANSRTLIRALHDAARYPHPVQSVQLIETHISWVLLTGTYAYKIKKPVDLGFLDFSTLERRRHCCHEELRLNRRLAPDVYLDVVSLTGTCEQPQVNGTGPVVEYAVRMRQFPQQAMLENVLARGALITEQLDRLAARIAAFHEHCARAEIAQPYGDPATVYQPMQENFEQLRNLPCAAAERERLARLEAWTTAEFQRCSAELALRKAQGYIRECHGDLHLGNMVLLDDAITPFDGIEFNPNLYWIDVISEVAFLMMDLQHRGRTDWAWRFLNLYLEHTGDYEGLTVLRLYQVYRAMVRAKVTGIRAAQEDASATERQAQEQAFSSYVALAEQFTRPARPALLITHGLSGSGKTTHSLALLERLGAVRIRSDVQRKRLFGLTASQPSGSGLSGGIYTQNATEQTYQHLAALARLLLQAGLTVIVDATFLHQAQRQTFHSLSRELDVPFAILHYSATPETLRARITARAAQARDASEADLAVLERQFQHYMPLSDQEQASTVTIDTEHTPAAELIAQALRNVWQGATNA